MVNVESLTKRLVSRGAMIVALAAICGTNAYATDPAIGYSDGSYATDGENMCVYDVLSTYTGPANLQAQWNANEIQLRWYNNNTQVIASESTTCNYDSTLTIPQTAPSRTGYTFAGWHVRPVTTFSALGLSTGIERWGKGTGCYHGVGSNDAVNVACNSDSHFTEMNIHEWQVLYDANGKTLYGEAHCSAKAGNNSSYTWPQTDATAIAAWQTPTKAALDAVSGEKKYCWCKATGYKANSSAIKQGADTPLAWVFTYDNGSASSCAYACAAACAFNAQNRSAFRAALFLGAGTAE